MFGENAGKKSSLLFYAFLRNSICLLKEYQTKLLCFLHFLYFVSFFFTFCYLAVLNMKGAVSFRLSHKKYLLCSVNPSQKNFVKMLSLRKMIFKNKLLPSLFWRSK